MGLRDLVKVGTAETLNFRPDGRLRQQKKSEVKVIRLSSTTQSFFHAMGPVLAVAQIFGAMPVYGVTAKDPTKLKFRWKSFRYVYAILMIVSQIFFFATIIKSTILHGTTMFKFTLYVVYTTAIYVMINMLFIARKWPSLMIKWYNLEMSLPHTPASVEKTHQSLTFRIRKIAIIVTALSFTEHFLGIIATAIATSKCPSDPTNLMKSFFEEHLPVFFQTVSYTGEMAFIAKFANVVNTVIWFYVDLFIMLIAIGLSSVFKRYCDYLLKFTGRQISKTFWDEQRNIYRSVCELVEAVDNVISPITIVSFSNNLYFVCLQLMNTLTEKRSRLHSVYFWYTLIYLIGRTAAVCLFSAEINEQSKRPMMLFRHVPLESWCSEAKRFSEDVIDTVSALSGMKFFYLTRRLLLSVAGTIVTYELVILQFYQPGSSGIKVCNSGNSTEPSSSTA